MKRTFFIVLLAIFFTFDIFFAISSAVADNLKSSPNVEILHPGEGKKVMLGNTPVIFKTIASDNAPDQFSITESVSQPQEGAPMHKHAPEAFYVVSGEFEFYAAQPDGTIKTLTATAGDLVNVPAGVPHAPKNVGDTPGTLLTVTAPGWFQDFLAEVSTPAKTKVSNLGVPNIDRMTPIGEKYGIEFVDLPGKTRDNS